MSAFDRLANHHLAPDLEPPAMKRLGSAVLGKGFFGSMPYRNLLRVGSSRDGLVLALFGRQLLIPWALVVSAQAPRGILPREKWLVGAEQAPLIVPRGRSSRRAEQPPGCGRSSGPIVRLCASAGC